MPEPSKRIVVDGIDFRQLFLFPKLFHAVTSALQPSRLVMALFMIVTLVAFGRLWDGLTEPNVNPRGLIAGRYDDVDDRQTHQVTLRDALRAFGANGAANPSGAPPEASHRDVLDTIGAAYRAQRLAASTDSDRLILDRRFAEVVERVHGTRPKGDFEATVTHVSSSFSQIIDGVLALQLGVVLAGLYSLFIETPLALWQHQTWFALFFSILLAAVLAMGGGAISRMTACQIAGGERISMRDGVDFALSRWGRLAWALLLPGLIVLALCAVIIVLGLLMGAPVLDLIGGVLYGVALVFGFLIAFLLVGYALGFPMLVPAVACENCDGADAMQRAYAYAVTRPMHLLGYWLVALVGLALGFLLVSLVSVLMLNVTRNLYDVSTDSPALLVAGGFEPLNLTPQPSERIVAAPWHARWAAAAISFWQAIVLCLIVAYVVSYAFSVSTIGYLLMRRASDGQDMEEIWRPGLVPGTLTPEPQPVEPAARAAAQAISTESAAESEGLD